MPDASGVGRFIEVNQVACRTLGYSRDEFIERTSGDIISADCLAQIPGITREFGKKGGSTFELFLVSKEGVKNGQTVILSIARDITDRKRAEIVSEEGRGTRFTIYLPRLAGSAPTPLSAPAADHCLNGSETVLVVDDEEMVRSLAQRILSRYGYRVMSAKDGRSAVEIYRREKGIGLVLLDMTMPGLSGRETLGELKKQDPGTKVLLSSGYSLNGLGEDLLTNGAAGFVQKPYRASELARAVRQALDMKKGT